MQIKSLNQPPSLNNTQTTDSSDALRSSSNACQTIFYRTTSQLWNAIKPCFTFCCYSCSEEAIAAETLIQQRRIEAGNTLHYPDFLSRPPDLW